MSAELFCLEDITSDTGRQLGRESWVVRGPRGYLGRYELSEPLRDDMPAGLAGCFSSVREAMYVARAHFGSAA